MVRTNISIASKPMMADLGFSQVQMGQVFSAFMLGYAIFQAPAGLAGDRFGPRAILAWSAAGWAALTALTGAIASAALWPLLAIRFLLGVAEAAMYPVAGRAVAAWVPEASRAFSNSVVVGGLAVGSAISPPLVAWLMTRFGWRESFYFLAIPPVLLALAWWRIAPGGRVQGPEESAGVPWWTPLRNRNVALLSVSYFLESYIQYIFLFWFFLYLVDVRGFTPAGGGILTSVPYLVAIVSMPAAGYLSDRVTRNRGARMGRAWLVLGSFTLAAGCLIAGTLATNPYISVAGIALCVGLVLATEGPYWAAIADVAGPAHAGAAGGIMNTAGNLAGVASTALVPVLIRDLGWTPVFYSAAALAIVAGLLWLALRTPQTRGAKVT